MAGTKKAVLTAEEESVMKSCSDEVTYRLTDDRRDRLESIGFVWNIREFDKGAEAGRIARNSYDDQWVGGHIASSDVSGLQSLTVSSIVFASIAGHNVSEIAGVSCKVWELFGSETIQRVSEAWHM